MLQARSIQCSVIHIFYSNFEVTFSNITHLSIWRGNVKAAQTEIYFLNLISNVRSLSHTKSRDDFAFY